MDDKLMLLITILGNFLNITLHTLFYYKTIGLNDKYKKYQLALVILFMASYITIVSHVLYFTMLSGISIYIVTILYPAIFMGGSLKERFLFGILSCVMTQLSTIIIDVLMRIENFSAVQWFIGILACNFIFALMAIIIILFDTNGKKYLPRKYWIGTNVCFTIVAFVSLIGFEYKHWRENNPQLYSYLILFLLGFFLLLILLYIIFYFVCKYFTKNNEANMLNVQNDMMERYVLQKQASDEHIKILSHDLRHSLTQWRNLAEEKGDIKALENISEYEQQLTSSILINIGNESANSIINQKRLEAQQKKVDFIIEGFICDDLIITKLDICSLLGNLLDNAFEATTKIDETDLRCVKLSLNRKGNLLIVVTQNSYAAPPVLKNGLFVTSKKDKEHHAIGTLSIRHITNKYNGVIKNTFENNWFESAIMLSGYKDE